MTFFDTAQAYGFGVSERVLGEALQPELKSQRDKIILSTKGGLRMEGELHLSQATLQEIKRIMREALPIGGPAPEGM